MTHAEHTNDLLFGRGSIFAFTAVDRTESVNLPKNVAKIDPPESPPGDHLGGAGGSTPAKTSPHLGRFPDVVSRAEMLGKYKRFVPVALAYGALSKMPNTKVGCVILGASFQTLSEGWNGAPRGSNADVDGRLSDRATRLTWVCHAEANAIASAAMDGRSLKGSTLIVTLMPCMACAKSIVQAGIVRVLCPVPTDPRWAEDFNNARALFEECSVDLVYYDTIGERE